MNKITLTTLTFISIILLSAFNKSGLIGENLKAVKAETKSTFSINWTGSKVIGDDHTGTIAVKNNALVFEKGLLKGGSLEVDMLSLKCTDLDGEWKKKLEGHLHSDDFFSSQKFKTSSLKIQKVKAGKKPNTLEVTADLKIKETSLSHTFLVHTKEEQGQIHYTSQIKIDRTKYNVKYGSNNFFDNLGDKAIEDIFLLEIKFNVSK